MACRARLPAARPLAGKEVRPLSSPMARGDTPGVAAAPVALAGAIVPGVVRFIVMLSAQADVFGVGITAIVGSMLVVGKLRDVWLNRAGRRTARNFRRRERQSRAIGRWTSRRRAAYGVRWAAERRHRRYGSGRAGDDGRGNGSQCGRDIIAARWHHRSSCPASWMWRPYLMPSTYRYRRCDDARRRSEPPLSAAATAGTVEPGISV